MQRFLLKHIVSEHLFYFFESVTYVLLHYTLSTNRDDAFRKLLESSLNAILAAESEEKLKAKSHERTEQRTDYRNGTRERTLETRIGSIVLKVPRHRNYPFHTMIYELYQRNEAALITTMAEMVVAGVSTRKVSNVIETLCGATPSKSSVSNACKKLDEEVKKFKNRKLESEYPFVIADATYFKVRINRSVVSQALLIAIGINEHGQREIIGFDSYKNESKESWSDFFKKLKIRGLSGVKVITSDAHDGILHAMINHFPDVPWQRCHYHFTKNIVEKAAKKYQEGLRSELRLMFTASDLESATRKKDEIVKDYWEVAEKAMQCLEAGFLDAMTNLELPKRVRSFMRTSNHIERLNKELKRRSNVIGIFPNTESLIRLMGSVIIDIHDQWLSRLRRLFYRPALAEIEANEVMLKALAKEQRALLLAS